MSKLINLTPHTIVLRADDGTDTPIPAARPKGEEARVSATPGAAETVPGVPVPVMGRDKYGPVEGLPPKEEGVHFIVSAIVAGALCGSRDDVLVPGTGPKDGAIRDDANRIVAVTRLKRS